MPDLNRGDQFRGLSGSPVRYKLWSCRVSRLGELSRPWETGSSSNGLVSREVVEAIGADTKGTNVSYDPSSGEMTLSLSSQMGSDGNGRLAGATFFSLYFPQRRTQGYERGKEQRGSWVGQQCKGIQDIGGATGG